MVLPLDSFSTELLLKIFKYLDIHDLCKLRQTCKRFNEIIEKWSNFLCKNVKPLVTNQIHPTIANRSTRLLSPFERLRICRNWTLGIYKEKTVLYSRVRYIPWLRLEKNLLWISRGGRIQAYERNKNNINTKNVVHSFKGSRNSDFGRFVKKGNFVLGGQTDGSLWLRSLDDSTSNFVHYHTSDVNSVDMNDDILVSGSRDSFVKISSHPQKSKIGILQEIDLNDVVWSVALSEQEPLLAIGTAGLAYISTVGIFDLNKQTESIRFEPDMIGAGVLDMQWESSSTLWSTGYDGYLRKWDLRTGKCEQTLSDPCDATVYCFQHDCCNSIIGGTQTDGRVVLWDTRQNHYVQMYFMECCRRRDKSSPVYSLSYDAEALFTVTDRHVTILDFSIPSGEPRDYSNLFTY